MFFSGITTDAVTAERLVREIGISFERNPKSIHTFKLLRGLETRGDFHIPDTDFDGDGETDMTIWRPSTGIMKVLFSRGHWFYSRMSREIGKKGDIPLANTNFDGD